MLIGLHRYLFAMNDGGRFFDACNITIAWNDHNSSIRKGKLESFTSPICCTMNWLIVTHNAAHNAGYNAVYNRQHMIVHNITHNALSYSDTQCRIQCCSSCTQQYKQQNTIVYKSAQKCRIFSLLLNPSTQQCTIVHNSTQQSQQCYG